MAKTRASRNRSSARASTACQFCKERRVRCDGGPNKVCSQCRQRGQPCLFGTAIDRRRSDFRAVASAFANYPAMTSFRGTESIFSMPGQQQQQQPQQLQEQQQQQQQQPVASSSSTTRLPSEFADLETSWPSPTPSQLEDAEQMLEAYRAWTGSVESSIRVAATKATAATSQQEYKLKQSSSPVEPSLIDAQRDLGPSALVTLNSAASTHYPPTPGQDAPLSETGQSTPATTTATSSTTTDRRSKGKGKGKGKEVVNRSYPNTNLLATSSTPLSTPSALTSASTSSLFHRSPARQAISIDSPSIQASRSLFPLFIQNLGVYFPFLTFSDMESDPPSPFLANAICSLAARYSNDEQIVKSRDTQERYSLGLEFAERSKSIMIPLLIAPSRDTVMGLLLLAWHEYSMGNEASTWMFCGMATRMALDVGLQKETNVEGRERDSKLFWSLYCLENVLALRMGRSMTIRVGHIQQKRPQSTPFASFVAMMGHAGTIADLMEVLPQDQTQVPTSTIEAFKIVAEELKQDYDSLIEPSDDKISSITSQIRLWTFALLCHIDSISGIGQILKGWDSFERLEAIVDEMRSSSISRNELHPLSSHAWMLIARHDILHFKSQLPFDSSNATVNLQSRMKDYFRILDTMSKYWASTTGVERKLKQELQLLDVIARSNQIDDDDNDASQALISTSEIVSSDV